MTIDAIVSNILIGYFGEKKSHKVLTDILIQNKEYCKTLNPENKLDNLIAIDTHNEIKELEEYIFDKFGKEF